MSSVPVQEFPVNARNAIANVRIDQFTCRTAGAMCEARERAQVPTRPNDVIRVLREPIPLTERDSAIPELMFFELLGATLGREWP